MAVFNTFTFDGENSLDYGVYITGEAVYNAPERAVEMVSIPGKNGALALDQGRFENIEVTYPAGTFGGEQAEFAGRMRAFRNMLASRYNYVRLSDSYHLDEYRLGLYKSGLEATPVAISSAGEFDITFNCKPQRFLTSGEEPIDTSELGGEVTTNREPYLFRRSGGGSIGHDFDAEIDKIIGGTVAWNQLAENDASKWFVSNGGSGSYDTTTKTFSFSNLSTGQVSVYTFSAPRNHVLLITAEVEVDNSGEFVVETSRGWAFFGRTLSANSKTMISGMLKPTSESDSQSRIQLSLVGVSGYSGTIKDFQMCDLTALFGSAEIADYVYSLEQTTAGAGVAWLKSHGFIDGSYRAYDSGSLQSVKTSAHVMRDENDVVIGNYPLDSDLELRGLFKLDANNNLYADGDEYAPDGSVTRNWNTATYNGSEYGWSKHSSGRFYLPSLPSGIDASSSEIRASTIASRYCYAPENDASYSANLFQLGGSGIYVNAVSENETLEQFKTRLSNTPLVMVYPLATPTTETADPYASPQVVNPLGTEEYVDTRDVPVPVGHETKYGMSQLILTNPTEFPSKPLLEVTGVGTFWLGDTLFTITGTAGQTIYIDCETGEAWKNVGGIITPANGLVTLNRLDFPELDPGDTPVMYGTGITKVVVTPRWWII